MATMLPAHLEQLEVNLKKMAAQRALYTVLFIGATTLVVLSGIGFANVQNASPFSQGIGKIFDYPVDMAAMAVNEGWRWWRTPPKYIGALLETFNMALFSTLIGFFFAAILSCFASSNIMGQGVVVQVTRRVLDVARSFPELVIATILLYLMGKNLLPAVIAIAIHTTGALGKLFSEAIENIDKKPLEGLQSVGASWFQRIWFGVFPQVMPLFFSYTLLRLEINVRASTILGFVGAGGIGEALNTQIQWRDGGEITAIMVLLIATIIALDYFSSFARGRLIGGQG